MERSASGSLRRDRPPRVTVSSLGPPPPGWRTSRAQVTAPLGVCRSRPSSRATRAPPSGLVQRSVSGHNRAFHGCVPIPMVVVRPTLPSHGRQPELHGRRIQGSSPPEGGEGGRSRTRPPSSRSRRCVACPLPAAALALRCDQKPRLERATWVMNPPTPSHCGRHGYLQEAPIPPTGRWVVATRHRTTPRFRDHITDFTIPQALSKASHFQGAIPGEVTVGGAGQMVPTSPDDRKPWNLVHSVERRSCFLRAIFRWWSGGRRQKPGSSPNLCSAVNLLL